MRLLRWLIGSVLLIQQVALSQVSLTHVSPSIIPPSSSNLAESMMPANYLPRKTAVYNIALIYYGTEFGTDYLDHLEKVLVSRFTLATKGILKLKVVKKWQLPYLHLLKQEDPTYTLPHITEIERLQRLWYYYQVNINIMSEIYQQVVASWKKDLAKLDAIVAVTGAQFDGLGYTSGRVSVTENPTEIAWGLEDGGSVSWQSDFRVVDELIHEIGHSLYLDHSATQCQSEQLSIPERNKCCEQSPSKNDVMSYCRDRDAVNEKIYHGFSACSLGIIKNQVVPAMLKGKAWRISNLPVCE